MKVLSAKNLDIKEVISVLEEDVIVIPTETVYGLAASINNEKALRKIFELKKRPCDNPLIVHVSSREMLKTVIEGEIPDKYEVLMQKFWPGPLSLLFRANKNVSKIVTAGHDTILVRIPDNETVIDIINKFNVPLAAPSANISGRPSPSCVQHSIFDFGSSCPLYIDSGECKLGLESTVFSYLDKPVILRPGVICKENLESILGEQIFSNYSDTKSADILVCPGQKYKHYSPKNRFILITRDNDLDLSHYTKGYKKIGILSHYNFSPTFSDNEDVLFFDLGDTIVKVAKNFYKGLRYFDEICDLIITKAVSCVMEGDAVMDRMKKSAHKIID